MGQGGRVGEERIDTCSVVGWNTSVHMRALALEITSETMWQYIFVKSH